MCVLNILTYFNHELQLYKIEFLMFPVLNILYDVNGIQ